MRIIKAIVSLTLIYALMCAAPVPGFAAGGEAAPDKARAAYEILTAVGILDAAVDELQSGEPMSRGVFVRWAVQAGGNAAMADTLQNAPVFSDVAPASYGGGHIAAAYRLGYIDGDPGGLFRPEEAITGMQALKIVVCALGYRALAEQSGGYPVGYAMAARQAGIFVPDAKELTYDAAALLLLDAAEADLMSTLAYGEHVRMARENSKTLLSERFSVYTAKGVVDANRYTHLMAQSGGLPKGAVSVDGRVFQEGNTGAGDLLGLYVKLYYHDPEDAPGSGAPVIRHIAADGKKNTVVEIGPRALGKTDRGSIEYYDGQDRRQTARLSPNATLIRNGKMAEFDGTLPPPKSGGVTLISNSGELVDVIKVMSYETYTVSNVSAHSFLVATREGAQPEPDAGAGEGAQLNLDPAQPDTDVRILKNGAAADFSAIRTGSVLSYAKSSGAGQALKTVLVSDASVSGTVSAVDADTLEIDGVAYAYHSAFKEQLRVGLTGRFLLDAFGVVAAAESEQDIVYGYLRRVDQKGLGPVQARIFTENNRWVTLPLRKKVVVNGERSNPVPAAQVMKLLEEKNKDYHQMIRYLVNASREISAIDIAGEIGIGSPQEKQAIETDTFRISFSGSKAYRRGAKSFSGALFVDPGAKIFLLPAPGREDDEGSYAIMGIGDLNADRTYDVTAYDVDEYTVGSVFSLREKKNITVDDVFMVVKSMGQKLNSDGAVVPAVHGWWNGSEISLPVELSEKSELADAGALARGDLIQFTFNNRGMVDNIRRYDTAATFSRHGDVYAVHTVLKGIVKKYSMSRGGLLLLQYEDASTVGIVAGSSTAVYIYEKNQNRLSTGEAGDLLEGDNILASMNYLLCRVIFVFRD